MVRITFALSLCLSLLACVNQTEHWATPITGGNPEQGKIALQAYGCGACHTIPGINSANSLVGPPLIGIAQRTYIAGVLVNTPDNLVCWIRNPQAVDPQTAMPDTGVNQADARDIAAYLYSLD